MLCAIYKSAKKNNTYLYLPKRDQFDAVPDALRQVFGKPIFLMMFNLAGNKPLANADKRDVIEKIQQQGFYLQMLTEEDIFRDLVNE